MFRRALLSVIAVVALLSIAGLSLYFSNTAPAVPVISTAEASSGKPYVVKLHAQWCPVCMVTKGVWAEIEDSYAGRVNLLVLDFTDEESTAASEAEARRLGLQDFYAGHAGWTGAIAVLDGRTREAVATLGGMRDFAEYSAYIESALAGQ